VSGRRVVALLLSASIALAPDAVLAAGTPVVFLHGFGSQAADWKATAVWLKDRLQIKSRRPELTWRNTFESQAHELQVESDGKYGALPNNTIAVGHSNGGLVAREWSRLHRLGGIITLGTPHRGAPILPHFQDFVAFEGFTQGLLNQVVSAFTHPSPFSSVSYSVQSALGVASDTSIDLVLWLAGTLGFDAALPVAAEMAPSSSYLGDLNGSANLSREVTAAPNRVGIVSIAHNYFYAGPMRAIAPDQADIWAGVLYGTASTLLFWGNYILVQADPSDPVALEQGFSLIHVAEHILDTDSFYCKMVSRADWSECRPNDGIVPDDSQRYPNAPNITIGTANDGPAHTQEKDWATDVLYTALVQYTHILPYDATSDPAPDPVPDPAPDPAPQPPPPPPVIIEPDPDPVPPGPTYTGADTLQPDARLLPGEQINSADGRYHFVYQDDGNLVLYDLYWRPLWDTGTWGTNPGQVIMQLDGNLVVYTAEGTPVWDSEDSIGYRGCYLLVQNDGNVVIYDEWNMPVWDTETWE
jgi:pimeloyl-ACP methyl ester carboxylesterase